MTEKRALQMSIAIAALLPIVAGLWGIALAPSGDGGWTGNHHRYLSGLLLAIGLGYWSAVPKIEAMGTRIRLLTALVAMGGLARLLGLALGDMPTAEIGTALAMELAVAPLLCLWQTRVIVTERAGPAGIANLVPHLRHTVP